MENYILVNKKHPLDKNYLPDNLVNSNSRYKKDILINRTVLIHFKNMQSDMAKLGFDIDIMSGYRDYLYQEKLYNNLLKEKGFAYTYRSIAKPGCSEHQTGLAIDICIYRNNKCYIEQDITGKAEEIWLKNNAYKYGFILRYPKGKENITGYNYEPWHYRFVGDIAKHLFFNNLTLEEYVK